MRTPRSCLLALTFPLICTKTETMLGDPLVPKISMMIVCDTENEDMSKCLPRLYMTVYVENTDKSRVKNYA